jgi:CheY-like chemotaxis protein
MQPRQQSETILVVDDSIEIRALTQAFLENAGYVVAIAADGHEGLTLFRAQQRKIVLLLTDVSMPNMNGFELADRVLELEPDLPVLFMSGNAWNADRGLGCVSKPFTAPELLSKVSEGLGKRGKARESLNGNGRYVAGADAGSNGNGSGHVG